MYAMRLFIVLVTAVLAACGHDAESENDGNKTPPNIIVGKNDDDIGRRLVTVVFRFGVGTTGCENSRDQHDEQSHCVHQLLQNMFWRDCSDRLQIGFNAD